MSHSDSSTARLQELKRAQTEAETRLRLMTGNETARLEAFLKRQTDKYLAFKIDAGVYRKNEPDLEKAILKSKRESKFYQDKINGIDINRLELRLQEIKAEIVKLETNREELKKVNKALEEFANLEPTNEALQQKIDELKKSRLSVTFVDEQPTP